MAYSKAKLESNEDKASPCFWPFTYFGSKISIALIAPLWASGAQKEDYIIKIINVRLVYVMEEKDKNRLQANEIELCCKIRETDHRTNSAINELKPINNINELHD